MSIPEQISGISLGSAYIRPGTVGPITSVTYIAGGWITVDSYSDLTAIDHSRTSTGQLAYISGSGEFYIAKKEAPDYVTTFDDTVTWYRFQLPAFPYTGSAIISGSLSVIGTVSGSFIGNGSGLTGVPAAPAGIDKAVQFRSGSAVAGAVDFVYDHTTGRVGIGTVSPSAKLVVDGDAIITGIITAQEFHTEFVSASIIYQSGSTKFGDTIDDTHQFTGSVNISGSVTAYQYSGSFIGDGSGLTGIATNLILTGSTGNDSLNLKTDSLTITGSAKNIDVAVTDNTVTISVPNNLTLNNVNLTGSFSGTFSGSVDAVILNAVTASYVLNAVSASYASFAATSLSASYAATASSADSFTVRTALTASGLRYPTTDGVFNGQVLQTDAAGTLAFGNVAAVFEDIYNGEATTVVKGTALYVSGAVGATPKVYRADAADPTKMPVTFLAMENIGTGAVGRGITLGLITGINMTGYAVGENLYVNGNGVLTSTRPTGSTDIVQPIGIVTKTGAGGQLNVLNPGPTILPNLTSGSIWAGNSTNFPVALPTASLSVARAVSASYATTASFATTASLALTASSVGVLDQNVVISGNLQVFGTSSFTYVTSSQLAVQSAFISVNVFEPSERFGGLRVYDSGSSNATASLAWDSQRNHWVYENVTGSIYTGGMLMSGPRHTGSLGDEPELTRWFVARSDGGDHLDNTQIFSSGSTTIITGSLTVTQNVVAQSFTGSFTGSFAGSVANAVTASHAVNALTASHAFNSITASYLFPNATYGEGFSIASNAANQITLTRPSGTTSTATFTVSTASYAFTAVTASYATGYAKGTGAANEVTIWKDSETVSGSSWLRVTSSIDGFGTPGLLIDGNYYSYAQSSTGGNGFVAQSGSLATTASIIGVNASQFEGQLYSSNGAEVKGAFRVSSLYTDGYTIGRLLTPGANNLLRIAPDVLILGTTTINGDLVVGGKVTAEEFHTEFISASIIYRSGSTKFGDTTDDAHQFTGSVYITSQVYAGLDTEILPNIVGYNTATGELTYYASSSVRATAIPGGSDNQIQYNDNGNLAGASNFVWDGTNVGIGTSAPTSKLTVDGDSSEASVGIERTTVGNNTVIGAINFTNNNAGTVYGRVRGGRNSAGDGYVSLGTGLGDALYVLESSNIGIGTVSPAYKLDVNGNTFINSAIIQKSGTNLTNSEIVTTNEYRNHNGPVLTNGSPSGINSYGTFRGYQAVYGTSSLFTDYQVFTQGAYANPIFEFYSGNGGSHSGALPAASAIRDGYLYQFVKGPSFSGTGAGTPVTSSNSNLVWGITSGNNAYFSGSVGIGITSPQHSLDVYTGMIGSSTSNLILTSTNYNTYIRAAAGYSVVINDTTSANVQMVNGGGSVGIGTTNPGYLLDVAGTSRSDMHIFRSNQSAPTADSFIFRPADNTVALGTANSERLRISSTGALKLNSYGSGTFTGTATKTLAVDSSGNVIELDVSSNGTGAANQVAFWKDTDTVSGSASLTWNGSTFYINGTLEATEKSFVINHPTQEGKKLVYGVLEGPEHAVYCRGKISGEVIELPEEWTGLVDSESITVQLTPIGKHQNLYVVDIKDNKVFIKNGDLLTSKINAYYYIQATRKDIKPLTTVREA